MRLSTAISLLKLLVTHPDELRSIITYRLWHEKRRDIAAQREHPTSGWDRKTMRRCWEFLDMTSRSFSAVIKELDDDLARVICLYYLVLRGLDTIEDDTTIPDDVKQPLMRTFHLRLSDPGWTYDKIQESEKDRQLLVEYDVVIDEIVRLEPRYREPITDIAHKMATGMADFCHRAAISPASFWSVLTWEEYDLYCHYVAGLVGEGLSRLFSASEREAPFIGNELVLSNSMGLLLQKTNILRDFREDLEGNRLFWPKECWVKHGFEHPREMCDEENVDRAVWALNEMILDAMRHSTDALDYLTLLRNQSVFNFVAIPATMAIATLEVCFGNKNVLQRNVKIRKGQAVQLIMRSTNPRDVAFIFRDYARKIHAKSLTTDPNFISICTMCARIEQWVERHYPSYVDILARPGGGVEASISQSDPRSRLIKREQELELQKTLHQKGIATKGMGDKDRIEWELMLFVIGMVGVVCILGITVAWLVAKYLS